GAINLKIFPQKQENKIQLVFNKLKKFNLFLTS
ncbi:MAG: hypothetical protein ACI8RD_013248, partial [Bacillariaceae sp.]